MMGCVDAWRRATNRWRWRLGRLVGGLASENKRWGLEIEELKKSQAKAAKELEQVGIVLRSYRRYPYLLNSFARLNTFKYQR